MGNRPRTKNGQEMAAEMAGSHFGGGSKWLKSGRANGRTCRKLPKFSCPAICLAKFRPFWNPPRPRNGCRPFRRPFLGHFRFWAGLKYPLSSRLAKSQGLRPAALLLSQKKKDVQHLHYQECSATTLRCRADRISSRQSECMRC